MQHLTRGIINSSALLALFTLTALLKLNGENRHRPVVSNSQRSTLLTTPEPMDREVILDRVAFHGGLFLRETSFGEGGHEWEELETGNTLCRNGLFVPAVERWESVLQKYAYTEIQIAALENIAACHLHFGKKDEAISTYERILARPPLAMGCNTGHYACAALTDLWLEKGDKQKALKYAELALTEHPYSDICGMAAMSMREIMEERVEVLRNAIASNSRVYLQPVREHRLRRAPELKD